MNIKTFKGGYKFRHFEGRPKDILKTASLPKRVVIPLLQGFGLPLKAEINLGDEVFAGQILARNDNILSSPIHSSINGRVTSIEKKNYLGRETVFVTIEGDGSHDIRQFEGLKPDMENLSGEEINKLLYLAGITALDRNGIPTKFKSSSIDPEKVDHIIVNATDSDVYNINPEVIFGGDMTNSLFKGLAILKILMPNSKIHLVVGREKKQIFNSVPDWLNIIPVISKYPQGMSEMLMITALGRSFPYGTSPADIGVVTLSINTVLLVFETITKGTPLIEKNVALCGPGFKENFYLKTRIGTPIKDAIQVYLTHPDNNIILNNLLTGRLLEDQSEPVGKSLDKLIAFSDDKKRKLFAFIRPGLRDDSYSRSFLSSIFPFNRRVSNNKHGEERPCIQCGYCFHVCPAGINPTLIDRHLKVCIDETLLRYKINDCIECNLCSYVCPSKIPLAKNIKEGKLRIIDSCIY